VLICPNVIAEELLKETAALATIFRVRYVPKKKKEIALAYISELKLQVQFEVVLSPGRANARFV